MTTPFPPAVNLVTVSGAMYGSDTTARTGRVLFDLKQLLTDPTDAVSIPPYRAIAILGATAMVVSGGVPVSGMVVSGVATPGAAPVAGCFSIVLVATDNVNVVPSTPNTTWYYETTYDLDGLAPWTVNYLVPHTPAVTDVSKLAVAPGQN